MPKDPKNNSPKKKRVIIVHGYDGSPERDWLPWMQSELLARGYDVVAPHLPHPTEPDYDEWMSTLEKAVRRSGGAPDEDTHFVAHSLGVPTLVHYLARLSASGQASTSGKEIGRTERLGSALFVAGAMARMDGDMKKFSTDEMLVKEARTHLTRAVLMYSDNDPVISMARTKAFGAALDAEMILDKGKGHFSEDSDVFELPKALEAVLTF